MPLDSDLIAAEIKLGLSIICSTCRKYWKGKDAGLAGCGVNCGGPISGKDFSEYDGDLPDLIQWCFVCGADSYYALQVGQSERRIGVCQTHVSHLHEMVPKDGVVTEGQLFAARNGSMVSVSRLVQKPKTLLQTMAEQEKQWQDEDKKVAEALGIDPDNSLPS